jgi:hypothetical protein
MLSLLELPLYTTNVLTAGDGTCHAAALLHRIPSPSAPSPGPACIGCSCAVVWQPKHMHWRLVPPYFERLLNPQHRWLVCLSPMCCLLAALAALTGNLTVPPQLFCNQHRSCH